MPVTVSTLGFPRIGPRRELKVLLERYWSGKSDTEVVLEDAAQLRKANWVRQHAMGVTHLPSNDFSLYDHILDTSVMVGAIPPVYGWKGGEVPLETYFAMARGTRGIDSQRKRDGHRTTTQGLPALEMTKWFDTNYHYVVPEFSRGQQFSLVSTKPVDDFVEAKNLGLDTRPVLVGPVTYLRLGKSQGSEFDPLIPTCAEADSRQGFPN